VVLGLHGYSLASHPLGALHVELGHIVCVRREASSKVRVMDSYVNLDHMHHLLGTSQCWRRKEVGDGVFQRSAKANYYRISQGVNFLAPKLPSLDAIDEVEVDRNISS